MMRAANEVQAEQAVPAAESRYLRIAAALKEEIVAGRYPIGSLLPTEAELSTRFAVSRNTLREALRRLKDDGLIASRRGAGSVVLPPPSSVSYAQDVNSIQDMLALATNVRRDTDFIGMVTVDRQLSARIGLPLGEQWLALWGLGYSDQSEVPMCWAEYYIHRDFAAVGRLLQHHIGPIFPLIENLFGERIEEVSQEIAGALVPEDLAGKLQAEPGSAALEVGRRFALSDGRIAQVTTSLYPADRYRHSMKISRTRG